MPAERPSLARWLAIFVAADIALIAFVLLVLWASNGFGGLGLGGPGLTALILGSTGTAALGIALMALVFYSNRTGRDDTVYMTGPFSPDPSPPTGRNTPADARREQH